MRGANLAAIALGGLMICLGGTGRVGAVDTGGVCGGEGGETTTEC